MKIDKNSPISEILESLIDLLNNNERYGKFEFTISHLYELKSLYNGLNHNETLLTRNKALFHRIFVYYSALKEELSNEDPECDKIKSNPIIKDLMTKLNGIIFRLLNRLKTENAYNSEKFYNNKIAELEKSKENLATKLLKTVRKEEIEAIQLELDEANSQIKTYENKKQTEANIVTQWTGKINIAFVDFKKHLNPIRAEHKRLKWLFRTYIVIASVILLILISLEITACCKI